MLRETIGINNTGQMKVIYKGGEICGIQHYRYFKILY